jgi:hypothetical protein
MAGAPELACQLGDLGRRPAAAPVPERQVAGGGAAGCRSCPPAGVIMAGGLRAAPAPERQLPVVVRLGAGARPPARMIMAGGPRRPVLDGRQPVAGEGWGPGARPSAGDHGRGPRRP